MIWILFILLALSATPCNSCGTCNATSDDIFLTQNIVADQDVCIELKYGQTLDCNGYNIISNNSTIAVYIPNKATIINCNIQGFKYGVYLNGSPNATLYNNDFEGNEYGVFSNNSNIYAYNNKVCFNNVSDFYSLSGWGLSNGSENQCDLSGNWSDIGFPNECTYYCSNLDNSPPSITVNALGPIAIQPVTYSFIATDNQAALMKCAVIVEGFNLGDVIAINNTLTTITPIYYYNTTTPSWKIICKDRNKNRGESSLEYVSLVDNKCICYDEVSCQTALYSKSCKLVVLNNSLNLTKQFYFVSNKTLDCKGNSIFPNYYLNFSNIENLHILNCDFPNYNSFNCYSYGLAWRNITFNNTWINAASFCFPFNSTKNVIFDNVSGRLNFIERGNISNIILQNSNLSYLSLSYYIYSLRENMSKFENFTIKNSKINNLRLFLKSYSPTYGPISPLSILNTYLITNNVTSPNATVYMKYDDYVRYDSKPQYNITLIINNSNITGSIIFNNSQSENTYFIRYIGSTYRFISENSFLKGNITLGLLNYTRIIGSVIEGNLLYVNDTRLSDYQNYVQLNSSVVIWDSNLSGNISIDAVVLLNNTTIYNSTFWFRYANISYSKFYNNTHGVNLKNISLFNNNILCDNPYDVISESYSNLLLLKAFNNTCDVPYYNGYFFFDIGHFGCSNICSGNIIPNITINTITNMTLPIHVSFIISGAYPTYYCGVVINNYTEKTLVGMNGLNNVLVFDPANVLMDTNNQLWIECYNDTRKYVSNIQFFNISTGICYCGNGLDCEQALNSRYCSEVHLSNNISDFTLKPASFNTALLCEGHSMENISFIWKNIENFTLKDCKIWNASNVFVLPPFHRNVSFLNISFEDIDVAFNLTNMSEYYNLTIQDIYAGNVSKFFYQQTINYSGRYYGSLSNIFINNTHYAIIDVIYRYYLSPSHKYTTFNNITIENAFTGFEFNSSSIDMNNIFINNATFGILGANIDYLNVKNTFINHTNAGIYTTIFLGANLYNVTILNSIYGIKTNKSNLYISYSNISDNVVGILYNSSSYSWYNFLRMSGTEVCNQNLDIYLLSNTGFSQVNYRGYNNMCSEFYKGNDFQQFLCTYSCIRPIFNITLNITSPVNGSVINEVPIPINLSISGPSGIYRCGIIVNSSYHDWDIAWEGNLTPGVYQINISSDILNLQNQINLQCFYNKSKYFSNNVTFNISNAVCYCYDSLSCTNNINSPVCDYVILVDNVTFDSYYSFINVTNYIQKTFDCNFNWISSTKGSSSFVSSPNGVLNISNCNLINFSTVFLTHPWILYSINGSFIENLSMFSNFYLQYHATHSNKNQFFFDSGGKYIIYVNHLTDPILVRNISFFNFTGFIQIVYYFIYTYDHLQNISNVTIENVYINNSSSDHFIDILYLFYLPNLTTFIKSLYIKNVKAENSLFNVSLYSTEDYGVSAPNNLNITQLPVVVDNFSVPSSKAFYITFPVYWSISNVSHNNSNSIFENVTVNISDSVLLGGENVTMFRNSSVFFKNVVICNGTMFDIVLNNSTVSFENLTTTWSNPYIKPTTYCKPSSPTSITLIYPKNNSYVILTPPYDFVFLVNSSQPFQKCGIYLNNKNIYLSSGFSHNISPNNYPTGNLTGLILCEDNNNTYELTFNITFNKECICDSYETCNAAYQSDDCKIIYINTSLTLNSSPLFSYNSMNHKTISCMGNKILNGTFFEIVGANLSIGIKDCIFENMDAVIKIRNLFSSYITENNTILLENISIYNSTYGVTSNTYSFPASYPLYNISIINSNCSASCIYLPFSYIYSSLPVYNISILNSTISRGLFGIYVNHSDIIINNSIVFNTTVAALISDNGFVHIVNSNLSYNGKGIQLIGGRSVFNESIFCYNRVSDIDISDVDSLSHIGIENQCDSPGGTGYYDDINSYGCTYLCPSGPNNPPNNLVLSPIENATYYGSKLYITFNITDSDNLFPNDTLRVYMDLSGPIYFNASYISGTLATIIYENPLATGGLYYLTIYSRDRYKSEDKDIIAFYWYPDGCYCNSCGQCTEFLQNNSCSRIVINSSFYSDKEICLENVSKPVIGMNHTIYGNGSIGLLISGNAFVSNLTLMNFNISVEGSGNLTLYNVSLTNNTYGILLNDSYINSTNNYICKNYKDVVLISSSYDVFNTVCQAVTGFRCTKPCYKKKRKPPENVSNATLPHNITNNSINSSNEEHQNTIPSETPTLVPLPSTPTSSPPQTSPQVQTEIPSSVPQKQQPTKPSKSEHKIKSSSISNPINFSIKEYWVYSLIPLILFILWRIAKVYVIPSSEGYLVIAYNILNKPLSNKTIYINNVRYKTNKLGQVRIDEKPLKISMPYRIILKK